MKDVSVLIIGWGEYPYYRVSVSEKKKDGQYSRPMGGEGKLNTRREMGSSAAGRVQHSKDISWQARQKTPGLVRPQRPGATNSYEQKRPSPPESVANQEH